MAGNAVIGALRVVLGADSAALETGLKNAQSALGRFARDMSAVAAGIGLEKAFNQIASSLAGLIPNAIAAAAEMGRLSQSVGIPVEELSRLRLAAALSGVELGVLAKSIVILSKNMVSAASGVGELDVKGNKAAKAFVALGISVKNTDGSLRTSEEVLFDLAEKFVNIDDEAGKSALAMAIFGKAGAAMIPFLNNGAKGLREMMGEADKFGITLDTKTTQAAIAFSQNLVRMEKIKEGVVTQITARMLPAFEELSKMLLEARMNSGLMSSAADTIVLALKGTISAGLTGVLVFQRLSAELAAFSGVAQTFGNSLLTMWERLGAEWVALRAVLDSTDWETTKKAWASFLKAGEDTQVAFATMAQETAAAWKGLEVAGEETKRAFENLDAFLSAFWKKATAEAVAGGAALRGALAAPIIAASAAAKNALESYLDSQKKSTAAQQAEVETFFLAAGAKEKLKVQLQALTVAQNANIVVSAAMKAQIDAVALAAGNMAMKLGALRVIEETMPAWEKYNLELSKTKELFIAGELTAARYEQALRRMAESAATSWDIAGASIAGSIASAAGAFGKENKKMAAIAKAAGIVQGTISMFTGAAKALELPFPANLAAMAAVLATGAKLVASIKSQAIPSFAHGGDFMVGGSGGVDNNLVAMNLSRGERVTVDPPGTQGNGGDRTIELPMIDPKAWFRGDTIRYLLENISEYMEDGGRGALRLKTVTG